MGQVMDECTQLAKQAEEAFARQDYAEAADLYGDLIMRLTATKPEDTQAMAEAKINLAEMLTYLKNDELARMHRHDAFRILQAETGEEALRVAGRQIHTDQ